MSLPLRSDFDATQLRPICPRGRGMPGRCRGSLRWRPIYDGGSRTQAAELGGVSLQVVAELGVEVQHPRPERPMGRKGPGQPSL